MVVDATLPDQPGDAGAAAVNNLADALDRVAAGGLIKVFPGTYSAETLVVDKAITIEGAGNGAAVIRNENTFASLWVQTGGSLTLRELEFENENPNGFGLFADGDGAALDVDGVAFRAAAGTTASLVFLNQAPASALSIENSSFTGGAIGAHASVPTVELRGSTFHDHGGYAFWFNGDGTVESNTMTDCGDNACIFADGGATGTIADNSLSNPLTGPGPQPEGGFPPQFPFFHHVIGVFTGADVDITGNEIDGCGWGQCITTGVGANALIEGNVITAYQAQGTRMGIVAGDGAGGGAPAGNGSSVTVRNNEFIGVGAPITDRTNQNQYGFRLSAMRAEGLGSSLSAEGNTVTSAWEGLNARAGGSVSGSGNDMELLGIATVIHGSDAAMDVHGSDFTDYVHAIEQIDNTSSSLNCNWWGSASGPSNVNIINGQGASLYTPWATSPIAGTGQSSGCTGGL